MSRWLDRRAALALLREAGPVPTRDLVTLLAAVPASLLVELAGSSEDWWMRRNAVRGLAGRVDDDGAARLLDRVLFDEEVTEVRVAALVLLAAAGRREIVPAVHSLRVALEGQASPPHGMWDAVVAALARLGDRRVGPAALELRYDAWSHRRRLGEEAIGALEAAIGRDSLARAFGAASAAPEALAALAARHPAEAVRRWAVDVAPRDAAWIVPALADASWKVAEGAEAAVLEAAPTVEPALAALGGDGAAPPEARARAVLALLRRGRSDLAAALWKRLGPIALPAVPPAVRRAILYHYLPGERGSDARWQLEGQLDLGFEPGRDAEAGPDEPPAAIVAAAAEALRAAGLTVGEPIPIGTVNAQGAGSYVHLPVGGDVLEVSELGRFVADPDWPAGPARAALARAGFLVVDQALGAARFEGLGVYYFGHRDPLTVRELLFYWQD